MYEGNCVCVHADDGVCAHADNGVCVCVRIIECVFSSVAQSCLTFATP